MASSNELFPHTQDELRFALLNFAETLASDPAAAGVDSEQAATLTQLAVDFDRAMALIASPDGQTRDNVARKDHARQLALKAFRLAAGQIKANPAVAVEVKLALGMKVSHDDVTGRGLGGRAAGTSRRSKTPPETSPLIHYIGFFVAEGTHRLTYADSDRPEVRSKPHGVSRLDLFAVPHPPGQQVTDPSKAIYLGGFTRTPFTLPQNLGLPDDAWANDGGGGRRMGTRSATLFARWVTRTELKGPWSMPVTVNGV